MDYSLIEQGAGYAVYLDAGDSRTIDQESALKLETLDTAAKRAAWFDSVFSESNLEQSEEVWIERGSW